MTTYLIKAVLCSGIFLLAYFLLLEKEKMHQFNRFYLLGSLVLSLGIPLISFETSAPVTESFRTIMQDPKRLYIAENTLTRQPVAEDFDFTKLWWAVYGLVALIFSFRLVRNLRSIFTKIPGNAVIPYQDSKIVLINEQLTPHSFLDYIFVHRQAYQEGSIEEEILLHELTHVRQKHSLDILFIEIIRVIFWFNPLFILYKKAMQLNHEFLADEAVVRTFNDTPAYQYLLIDKASQLCSPVLTSQFNFLMTKKRLMMMTRTTHPVKAFFKQLAIVTVTGISVFLFSNRIVTAQTPPKISSQKKATPSNAAGASEEVLKEYKDIVERYTIRTAKSIKYDIPESVQPKLEKMYFSMSEEQQKKQKIYFGKLNTPLAKEVPTAEQIEAWKDPKTYGLWIDGKKTENSKLNNYKNTDFSHAFLSRLYGKARTSVNYKFQIDLMTTPHYNEYVRQTLANDKYYMMVRFGKDI
jgi:bla regulator protein BlaR1